MSKNENQSQLDLRQEKTGDLSPVVESFIKFFLLFTRPPIFKL